MFPHLEVVEIKGSKGDDVCTLKSKLSSSVEVLVISVETSFHLSVYKCQVQLVHYDG